MQSTQDLKQLILEGVVEVYREKGIKFTMDDLAKHLGMSKKTIYTVYRDKKTLFMDMVDHVFDSIKESERKVVEDPDMNTTDKIRKILGVLPDSYKNIDLNQLYILREKHPDIYVRVEERLETGWEQTIMLIEKGIEEGAIRPVNIRLIKMMYEASIEQFFSRDILVKNDISYIEALNQVVDIIVDGIAIRKG